MTETELHMMAEYLDRQIEKMDMKIAKMSLSEYSEPKVVGMKLQDVIKDELEFEDQLSAEGIIALLERNNNLVDRISILRKAEENVLKTKSLSREEKEHMLIDIIWIKNNCIDVVDIIDEVIEEQEKNLDERHADCICSRVNEDIKNYSTMDPRELKDIIKREGNEFWVKIGMSNMDDDKRKLFLSWIEILAKN